MDVTSGNPPNMNQNFDDTKHWYHSLDHVSGESTLVDSRLDMNENMDNMNCNDHSLDVNEEKILDSNGDGELEVDCISEDMCVLLVSGAVELYNEV